MKRLYIVFLAMLACASFNKVEGTYFPYNFFLLSDLKMIWPEYLYYLTIHISFTCLAWTVYLLEHEQKKEMLIFAILITGKGLDFILRCSEPFYRINSYLFSYDTFMFLIFSLVILHARLYETN